ncbi:MAG: GIY-YIG nuclease family protein [Ferruginibacter sp.]
MYYVYILESSVDSDFYKGSTKDYLKRLIEHNSGQSKFTKTKIPWKLVFVQGFNTKKDALVEEKRLKKCNKEYLRWLIIQPVNIIK